MSKSRSILIAVIAVVVVAIAAGIALWRSDDKSASSQPQIQAAAQSSTPWGPDYFPNVELIDQYGNKLHFYDDVIKDKVVMLNFIYTSCVDACPLETARMKQVQKLLGDRVGKDIFLYSITIDPDTDTPEVLNEYAKKFNAGPGWQFLWGSEPDVTQLRKKFGIYESAQDIKSNLVDHVISLIIGNQKTGQWLKASAFDTPQMVASKVGGWLSNFMLASNVARSYDEAPDLRHLSKGESLFRTRCAACHTIGGGDVNDLSRGDIGPDLLGVVELRNPAWLDRFIAEPDVMIQEKEPLAVELFEQYNQVLMPNLRLNEIDRTALIEYLKEESARIERVRKLERVQ